MSVELAGARPLFTPARLGVSLIFLANGFLIGSWAPKVPEFALSHGLSESALGIMILFFGLGSLVAMAAVGWAVAHRGSRPIVRWMAVVSSVTLLMVTLAPNVWLGALALFLVGALVGGTDVAMNANAVEVEKAEGRAIMSSCHGFWSLGGVLGSVAGGALIETAGIPAHAVFTAVVSGLLAWLAWGRLLADAPHAAEAAGARISPFAALSGGVTIWILGVMCLFSMLPEGAVLDWGALYLRQELGADAAFSGLAFGAFSATMALVRFAGDFVRDRFGAVATLRVSALLAMAGFVVAGLAEGPLLAVSGFGIAGLGLANMVPIGFSAAGNLPGLPKGIGISFVSVLGYSGILFFPSIIGFIAERTGFSAVFLGIPILLLVVMAGAGIARHADRATPGA